MNISIMIEKMHLASENPLTVVKCGNMVRPNIN